MEATLHSKGSTSLIPGITAAAALGFCLHFLMPKLDFHLVFLSGWHVKLERNSYTENAMRKVSKASGQDSANLKIAYQPSAMSLL